MANINCSNKGNKIERYDDKVILEKFVWNNLMTNKKHGRRITQS